METNAPATVGSKYFTAHEAYEKSVLRRENRIISKYGVNLRTIYTDIENAINKGNPATLVQVFGVSENEVDDIRWFLARRGFDLGDVSARFGSYAVDPTTSVVYSFTLRWDDF